jgi:hypothetical protein
MNTIDKLDSLSDTDQPFGPYQEEAIVSLAFDHPEFFTSVGRFLKPEMFKRLECQYVMAKILNAFNEHSIVPTRALLKDDIEKSLSVDDPFEPILAVLDRPSDHREVPLLKTTLLKWARDRAYGLIYSEEAMQAYHDGEYDKLEAIISEANKIADIGEGGFWFFENLDVLFNKDTIEHRTTGFPQLDQFLNNGGPSPKEVLCWLAATNVGKSVMLCNNAISSLKGSGKNGSIGQDVLFITFELDVFKTAMRILGSATGVPMDTIADRPDYVKRLMDSMQQTYGKRLFIYEMPPDECSVNHIYALLDNLRRKHGWHPDVLILDYLDLIVSRHASYNKDDYTRQKHVATEVRGLAKNENLLIFTATQTNRSGAGDEEVVDLTKAAESFGKQFPLDYIVSLNQSRNDRLATPPRLRMFIAKNRNGPKHEMINCTIDYNTMVVRESL